MPGKLKFQISLHILYCYCSLITLFRLPEESVGLNPNPDPRQGANVKSHCSYVNIKRQLPQTHPQCNVISMPLQFLVPPALKMKSFIISRQFPVAIVVAINRLHVK